MNLRKEDLEDAIRLHRGYLTKAAKELGVSLRELLNNVARYPSLKNVCEEEREKRLDEAEDQLEKKVQRGNLSAIMFYLSKQGKHRGWSEEKDKAEDKPLHIRIMPAQDGGQVIDIDTTVKGAKRAIDAVSKSKSRIDSKDKLQIKLDDP